MSRVETLKKFIEAHPSDPFPRYGLAQEYKNAGRFDEARAVFDALMRDHPDYTAAYLHAGNVLVSLGQRDDLGDVGGIGRDAFGPARDSGIARRRQ